VSAYAEGTPDRLPRDPADDLLPAGAPRLFYRPPPLTGAPALAAALERIARLDAELLKEAGYRIAHLETRLLELEAVLAGIADYDVEDSFDYVDEWNEAAAFREVRDRARLAIAPGWDDDEEGRPAVDVEVRGEVL